MLLQHFSIHCGKKRTNQTSLFSSPNIDLVNSIFSYAKDNLVDDRVINIGEQQYHLESLELLETRVIGKSCVIRTSTPVTIRIPEKAYTIYNIPEQDRKKKFLYWRANLSHDIFMKMALNNMRSKFKQYYNTDACNIESALQLFILLKEVVIHIPLDEIYCQDTWSFWRFHFNNLNEEHRDLLNFALDTGIGERNSAGLGFLNVEEGAKIARLQIA